MTAMEFGLWNRHRELFSYIWSEEERGLADAGVRN